jgi:thioredoxin:protein disulfide reductase
VKIRASSRASLRASVRASQCVVLVAILLVPTLAFAADGSDASQFKQILESHGAALAVLASFGFGFVASLTPCVYPMVPITVSIFGATEARSTSRLRGAALSGAFVLGIATLFTPMGVIAALTHRAMGSQLSNAWVVLGIATLFTALAASMFGAFELALPSSLTNRLSTVGGVGFKGAFVMGLVMGLIAAPCTGPFLTGILVVIGESGRVVLGAAALFSFSLGLGVLFFVAGAFAVSLPKGGAWMMGIKWVSGVGLAYMAFAYLRDRFEPLRKLVAHPSYAFGAVAGALLLVGVVLGVIHVVAERRRSPIAHLSKPMKLASILPAVVGAAMFLTWWSLPHGKDAAAASAPIEWLTDEAQARGKAAMESKPILVDFGTSFCAPCKKLERETFPAAAVKAQAARFVAIHVDASNDEDPDVDRLVKKYGVVGFPTLILLDKDAHEVARFNDFVTADQLALAMKKVPGGPGAVGMR